MMIRCFCFALFLIQSALQRKGTKTLPQFSPDVQTITKYVKNKTWALGFLSDLAGSLLMVSALANAPVSVIQPVSGGGLVILSLLSHFVFLEKLKQGRTREQTNEKSVRSR